MMAVELTTLLRFVLPWVLSMAWISYAFYHLSTKYDSEFQRLRLDMQENRIPDFVQELHQSTVEMEEITTPAKELQRATQERTIPDFKQGMGERNMADPNEGRAIVMKKLSILRNLLITADLPVVNHSADILAQNICNIFYKEGQIERPTKRSVWGCVNKLQQTYRFQNTTCASLGGDMVLDVTYVTHLSASKLEALALVAAQWKGPISASLYIHPNQTDGFLEALSYHKDVLLRNNIDIHLVFKVGIMYPLGQMRQVSLEEVKTSHLLLSDIDLVPDIGLYDHLKNRVIRRLGKKQVWVIPAFKYLDVAGNSFPQNKKELLRLWNAGIISQPHDFTKGIDAVGHRHTNYSRWKTATAPYKLFRWEEDYEPYIVAWKSEVPTPWQEFVEYYQDKIAWLLEIYAMRNTFLVDPNHFLIHMPHPSRHYDTGCYKCALELYLRFRRHLETKYPGFKSKRLLSPKKLKKKKKKPRKVKSKPTNATVKTISPTLFSNVITLKNITHPLPNFTTTDPKR